MKINLSDRCVKKILVSVILPLMLLFALEHADAAQNSAADKKPELYFYSLNVGQGDCSLFILPDGGTILIDAGPEEAARDVVRYIKGCGIKKIDLLVATHAHSDHIGGMKAVMNNFRIGKIWDSGFIHGSDLQKDFYRSIQRKKIKFGRPKRGFSEKMGNVLVEVLAPPALLRGTKSDVNNNSLVIRIKYGNVSFLMTGDMEKEQRETISPLPMSTVLKASHHGSSNGTDGRMLRQVRPELIILSYGYCNSYGYPHKEVVQAIAKMGIKRFDTKDGTVKIRTDGKNLTYFKNREVRANENTN